MNKRKLAELNRDELDRLLAEKREKYQEIEEEKRFVLSQSGRHIPGTLRREYKIELQQIEEQIGIIKEALLEKKNQT